VYRKVYVRAPQKEGCERFCGRDSCVCEGDASRKIVGERKGGNEKYAQTDNTLFCFCMFVREGEKTWKERGRRRERERERKTQTRREVVAESERERESEREKEKERGKARGIDREKQDRMVTVGGAVHSLVVPFKCFNHLPQSGRATAILAI